MVTIAHSIVISRSFADTRINGWPGPLQVIRT
jgi:hypothetical protein